jgi:hypothetical protein
LLVESFCALFHLAHRVQIVADRARSAADALLQRGALVEHVVEQAADR